MLNGNLCTNFPRYYHLRKTADRKINHHKVGIRRYMMVSARNRAQFVAPSNEETIMWNWGPLPSLSWKTVPSRFPVELWEAMWPVCWDWTENSFWITFRSLFPPLIEWECCSRGWQWLLYVYLNIFLWIYTAYSHWFSKMWALSDQSLWYRL